MERDRKQNQRNDTPSGTKTGNKKPIGTKKNKKTGTYSLIECSVSSSKDQSFRLTQELIISLVTDKTTTVQKARQPKTLIRRYLYKYSQRIFKCSYVTSIKRLSNLKEQKIDTNLKRMLRTVMKQLFNCTLLRLKAFIPNPKGYTHKTRFACDRNLNDKIKFKKSKEKKRKIEEKGGKMYKITDAKLR